MNMYTLASELHGHRADRRDRETSTDAGRGSNGTNSAPCADPLKLPPSCPLVLEFQTEVGITSGWVYPGGS